MFRQILVILVISLITFGLLLQTAEAKRFGGGRSFGYSRSVGSNYSYSRSAPGIGQNYNNNKPTNRWLGPLAGLAAGGLLASLFMGHGLGGSLLSILAVAALVMLVLSFLRRKMQPPAQYDQGSYGRYQNNAHFAQDAAAQFMRNSSQVNQTSSVHPIGFDEQGFLREAKVQFIRLQAAYDQKDINDIRDFTTPEVLAEIQLQWHERGEAENKTNVISVDAELLNIDQNSQHIADTEMQTLIASVRFTGMIQEDTHHPATAFDEIWHFKKEVGQARWIVAGVQQG
jgi:predicted lipid-binding transport protein (Tim44 family)